MTEPIQKSILIEDLVEKYPELVRPLKEHGIACIRCGEPVWGTLEEVAREKNIQNIDDIVHELNRLTQHRDK